jgi:ankyrin repeat protein
VGAWAGQEERARQRWNRSGATGTMARKDSEAHQAARRGDVRRLEELAGAYPLLRPLYLRRLVHTRGPAGDTPLHEAANAEVARWLLAHGAQVDARSWRRVTPLHRAVQQGAADVVRVLIEHGADVNAQREAGETPLHFACSIELVESLIEGGADVSVADAEGQTPLHTAVRWNRGEIVQYLLARGAGASDRDARGGTPLHVAVREGRESLVRMLLDAVAEVDAVEELDGGTPLHDAVLHGHVRVAALLIQRGASLTCHDQAGRPPFRLGPERGARIVAELLGQHPELTGTVLVHSSDTLTCRRVIAHPRLPEAITSIAWGGLARWAMAGGTRAVAYVRVTDEAVGDIAITPDGDAIAVAVPGRGVELRAWDSLELLESISCPCPEATDGHAPDVSSLAFSPDGRWLALANGGREEIHLFQRSTGRAKAYAEAEGQPFRLLFHPSSSLLAAAIVEQEAWVRVYRVDDDGSLSMAYEPGSGSSVYDNTDRSRVGSTRP